MALRKQHLALCFLATFASALCASPGLAETEPVPVAPEIQRLIRERLDAAARRDAVGWARYVDEQCICGGESRADVQKAISGRPSDVKNWYGDIGSFTVRMHGETAIALSDHRIHGSQRPPHRDR